MASPARTPGSDPFIVSTSLAKPDARTRRFIRSHVMRGKNLGKFKGSQRWLDAQSSSHSEDASSGAHGSSDASTQRETGWVLVSPRKIASELALYGFWGSLEPHDLQLVWRTFTIVKPAMYGLLNMTAPTPPDTLFCFASLPNYPGMLHSTLFAAQAFYDLTVGSSCSSAAQSHLAKALSYLQRTLDDEQKAVELSTMAAVTSLAMAAVISGDLATAAKHMDGLQKIVELRGGLQSLDPGSIFEHKANALDIGLSMAHGTPLRFHRADAAISWSPQLARGRAATSFPELAAAMKGSARPDPRLMHVWADLREFSRLVNDAAAQRTKLILPCASSLATSVPVRLLRLREGDVSGDRGGGGVMVEERASLHELLRLGMLAYAKMLLVALPGLGRKMTVLADGLKGTLLAWGSKIQLDGRLPTRTGDLELLFWSQVVAGVSIFEEAEEDWFGEMLRLTSSRLGLQAWAEARAVLKRFLWIDAVFDQPGELTFQRWCAPVQY